MKVSGRYIDKPQGPKRGGGHHMGNNNRHRSPGGPPLRERRQSPPMQTKGFKRHAEPPGPKRPISPPGAGKRRILDRLGPRSDAGRGKTIAEEVAEMRRREPGSPPRRHSPGPRSPFRRNFRSRSPGDRMRSPLPPRMYEEEKFGPPFFDPYGEPMPHRYSPPPQEGHHHILEERHELFSNSYEPPQWERNETMVHDNWPERRPEFEPPPLNWEDPMTKNHESENAFKFLSATDNHPDIPIFDAKDPNFSSRQWVKIIEDIGFKENWSSERKKFQMASKLEGQPKEWFIREDVLANSWNKAKNAFLKAFPSDMDYFAALQRMMARVKLDTESYANYFTYKTMLLNSCNISGRKAVSCLIGGLKIEEVKTQCLDQNFATTELLYTYLQENESRHKNLREPAERPQDPQESQMRNVKYCNTCKEYQHLTHQCAPPKPSGFIPQQQQQPQKQPRIESSYFIDAIINGYTLRGYNDPQSDYVTIREDEAALTKLHFNKYLKKIKAFRGNIVESLGSTNVLLTVGTAVVNVQIFIVPNQCHDFPIVLGESVRRHPDISYYEDMSGFHFSQKVYRPMEEPPFGMNEDMREIAAPPKLNVKAKDRLRPKLDPVGGGGYGGGGNRFDQPPNPRYKYIKNIRNRIA